MPISDGIVAVLVRWLVSVTSALGGSRSAPPSRERGNTSKKELQLALRVPGMRLHIHPFEGSGDGLCGSHYRAKEPITVTPAEIIYQRRLAVLAHAERSKNVAETCRVFGVSRIRYYEWKGVADLYGLAALMPKGRRRPQMPEATPTHVIEARSSARRRPRPAEAPVTTATIPR
jgi:hypothetical protein